MLGWCEGLETMESTGGRSEVGGAASSSHWTSGAGAAGSWVGSTGVGDCRGVGAGAAEAGG